MVGSLARRFLTTLHDIDDNSHAEKKEHDEEEQGLLEACVFLFCALFSFYIAEVPHFSGIISTLVCGLWCNVYCHKNLTKKGAEIAHQFFHLLMHCMEALTAFWVGIACVLSWQYFSDKGWAVYTLMFVMGMRAISVWFLATAFNSLPG